MMKMIHVSKVSTGGFQFTSLRILWLVLCVSLWGSTLQAARIQGEATASSTVAESLAAGAVDGDRFSIRPGAVWRGAKGAKTWWWQIQFAKPCQVGAILQINGSHPTILRNSARHYMWQWSTDAKTWHDLEETETKRERRMFRIHRLSKACWVQYLRLMIFESLGGCPTLREVEFRDDPSAKIKFSDWVISVSSTDSSELPAGKGTFWENLFVKLLHQCEGWENGLIQQMWIGDFDKSFVSAEPQPLCAFFTGCAAPWCKRTREPWRGVQEVLKHRNLPMWGACGGAQAFAILEDTGVDKPWDCPRCRDSNNPKSPIYTHIGYTDNSKVPCGNFDKNICERGKFNMRKVAQDPAFDGLPEVFEIMEYHCGQIAYLPKGWIRVVTKGPGALTVNQCLRVEDRYIYAAQFHMELPGTPENSRRIMGNFLSLAKEWGGYNPRGKPVSPPELGVSR